MTKRPTWDETWLRVAQVIAVRSQCARARVGCVLVTADQRVNATGYNGQPRGLDLTGRCDSWCPRAQAGDTSSDYGECVAIHAEANALVRADFSQLSGGTAYVTGATCKDCAKLLANAGLARVVMCVNAGEEYREPWRTAGFLRRCHLEVTIVNELNEELLS